MKTAVIVQARMGSSSFPGKVMARLRGKPAIWHTLRRCMSLEGADELVLAVPKESASEPLVRLAAHLGVRCYQGKEKDVLASYVSAARAVEADIICRVTGDCPLIDPEVCGQVIAAAKQKGVDYASNVMPRTFELGLDCEAFSRRVLEMAHARAMDAYDREHVTSWLQRAGKIKRVNVESGDPSRARQNWCLDWPSDLSTLNRKWPAVNLTSVYDGDPY